MKVSCNAEVTKELLAQSNFDAIPMVHSNLLEGFAQELIKSYQDEIVTRKTYRESVSFSLSLLVYTKREHRGIVTALLQHYDEDVVEKIMKGNYDKIQSIL